MTKAGWLMIYGVILFACGAGAYLARPYEAPTALVAGTIGGGLASMLGVFAHKGMKWALTAGRFLTVIFFMLALAMAMQHWLLIKAGGKDLISPVIDTLVVLVSAVVLTVLTKKA